MIWDSIRHSKTYNPDYSFYFGNNEKSVHTGSTLSEFCAAAAEKIVTESKDGRHYTTVTLDSSIGKKDNMWYFQLLDKPSPRPTTLFANSAVPRTKGINLFNQSEIFVISA